MKYIIILDKLEDCQQETARKIIRIDQETGRR